MLDFNFIFQRFADGRFWKKLVILVKWGAFEILTLFVLGQKSRETRSERSCLDGRAGWRQGAGAGRRQEKPLMFALEPRLSKINHVRYCNLL